MKVDADGNITIGTNSYTNGPANFNLNVSGNININTNGNATISANGNVDIKTVKGKISLGDNPMKQLVNNFDICPVIGCPHYKGNTQVEA